MSQIKRSGKQHESGVKIQDLTLECLPRKIKVSGCAELSSSSDTIDMWAFDDVFGVERSKVRYVERSPHIPCEVEGPPGWDRTGTKQTPEHIENKRQALIDYYETHSPKSAKPCVYEGVEYPSYAAAGRAHGVDPSTIRDRIKRLNNPKAPRVHKRDKRTGRFI